MQCCMGRKKPKVVINGRFRRPYYSFVSAHCGKALDIGPDNQLVIATITNLDTQKFQIQQKGPDYFLKNKRGKQFVTLEGPQNGAKVYVTSKDLDHNQRLRIQQTAPGSQLYIIHTFFGKVLDVKDALVDDGSIITQYDYISKPHQLWQLIQHNS